MFDSSSLKEIQQALDYVAAGCPSSACGCLGPQNDEPNCPCVMRSIIRWKNRWIQLTEARPSPTALLIAELKNGNTSSVRPKTPLNPKRLP